VGSAAHTHDDEHQGVAAGHARTRAAPWSSR
jgi:hypothetical protein